MTNVLKTRAGVNNECYTPPEVFEALGVTFDLDVASPLVPVPWVPAKQFYSLKDDGLSAPWEGFVWMNPPYSKPRPWVERFLEHGNGIALLQTSTGRWMDELWAAGTSWHLAPPIRFVKPDGTRHRAALPSRVWFVGIGEMAKNAIARLGVVR